MHQLVVRRTQKRVTRLRAEARGVDQRLRMFDPHPDRKRLCVHRDPGGMQRLETVTRAVPDRQHHVPGLDDAAVLQAETRDPPGAIGRRFDVELHDPRLEAVFPAQRLDGPAQALDHADQPEGADMRLGGDQDLLGGTGADELLQHLAPIMVRIADLAVELAVGERARAALAELHIAFQDQFGASPESEGIDGAAAHDAAALEQDRPQSHLRQHQAGQQSARAGTDHHRPRCREPVLRGQVWRGREAVACVGGAHRRAAGVAGEHRSLVAKGDIDAVDQADGAALAGVVAAPDDREGQQLGRRQPEPGEDGRLERVRRMVERQLEFGQAKHDGL